MTDAPEPLRAEALAGIPHGFFTRRGGVSTGIYDSLNCGPGSRDAAAAVAENRARVAAAMGVAPERLLTLHQAHTIRVVAATGPFDGPRPEADGLVTATPGLALGALAADCAPVLLADAGCAQPAEHEARQVEERPVPLPATLAT
jgi:copper oxidase (laccase) domain-containing protein